MKLLTSTLFLLIGLLVVLLIVQARPSQAQSALSLRELKLVDLTHPITSTIPIWPGDPELEIRPWAAYAKDGYFINRITIGEHSGTHWGTPNTFIEGATSAEQVPITKLVVPAVMIDIRDKALQNQDYQLSVADVQAWEAVNGAVPADSAVLLLTGWQSRWSDASAFLNEDEQGVLHWPGFSAEAAEFLVSQRKIVGLGTDTHGADPGNDEVYGASAAIYQADGMVLECLNRLDQLPAKGATLVVGGLPIQGGSGSPVRVFAFL